MSSKLAACSPIGTHCIQRNDESRTIIVDDVMIRFTPTQYRLLISLLKGSPVTDCNLVYEALSCHLKSLGRDNLDKHIDKIREKLRPSGLNIFRVVDYGYVLLAIPD